MDFGLLPPEINSGLMYAGPGSGPMLAAAASWDAVAAQLESAAAGYSSEISGLTGRWLGPSSMRMAAAGTRQVVWLQASAAQAAQTAAQAYTAAAAYDVAYAMTVPPPVIAANRAQLMMLVATNFFGQNTPAIAATEAHYMQMWVQDATAMYTYAADAEVASTLQPFNEPQKTTNESGQTDQANAVARSTAQNASGRTQSAMHQLNANAQQTVSASTPVNPGDTVTAPSGSTITLGPDPSGIAVTSGSVTAGPGATLGSDTSITLSPGTSFIFNVSTGGIADSVTYPQGATVTAGASPLTITPITGVGTVAGTVESGSATIVGSANGAVAALSGTTVNVAVGSTASITAGYGTVTISTAVPVIPTASGSSALAAAPLAASPGLAGTAGIQPQLDAEALTQFVQGLSGVDVVGAELAGVAG